VPVTADLEGRAGDQLGTGVSFRWGRSQKSFAVRDFLFADFRPLARLDPALESLPS
jgi:hypothetical protein